MSPGAGRTLVLTAPISGVIVPLEQVPDAVFAQRMVGDGVSIDPTTQQLIAPCDGRVVLLHAAAHAITVASDEGVEVMMHIGLDTVQLKGQGFSPRVAVGDRVARGDLLIDFDADAVAQRARSLLTEVVITNGERVEALEHRTGRVAAGTDVVIEVRLADLGEAHQDASARALTSEAVVIPTATGLHARPAAVLASAAKRFVAEVQLRRGDDHANAKSVVGIMGLEVAGGDKVHVVARGPDADAAIATLVPLLREGLGEEGAAPTVVTGRPAPTPAPVARAARSGDPNRLTGVPAAPGLAVGIVVQVRPEHIAIVEDGRTPHEERQRLDLALDQARRELRTLQERLTETADPARASIFAAHEELLGDPDLLEIAASAIDKGKSAAFAWHHAVTTHADRLAGLKNELLAARANDLRDVGRRVLRAITGTVSVEREYPHGAILVAEDLTPSETASLDRSRVLGFCTAGGGATSHVAILARSLGIPAVAAIEPRALDVADGTAAALDGSRGVLRLNPPPEEVRAIEQRQARLEARRSADLRTTHEPAWTADGHVIEVVANIGGLADAEQAVALGGEGVGLLRTEFLFLGRTTAPSDEEQAEAYTAIAKALGPDRPLIIRTLDVGGDKPLAYLPLPKEDNPFLGERGIRLQLARPELLRSQLRAILRAAAHGRVLVMFPMIASLAEWQAARTALEEERARLGAPPVPAGIMVEVPAAALTADRFAAEVDFFSVGTNDLTQYTLAIDRGHPRLASQVDGLHPAVLRLIAATTRAAARHGKWVGVCGGIAADPQAIPLMVGLGVRELSVSVPAIPAVKARVRTVRRADAEALVERALTAASAAEVRALVPDPDQE